MKGNEELHRLAGQIEALKEASVFNAREIAEAAMSSALRVLTDFERRLREAEDKIL